MLIAQLDAADVVVIATPMHNFTVPSTLKAWVDHIVRVRATFAITPQGKTGTLRDTARVCGRVFRRFHQR